MCRCYFSIGKHCVPPTFARIRTHTHRTITPFHGPHKIYIHYIHYECNTNIYACRLSGTSGYLQHGNMLPARPTREQLSARAGPRVCTWCGVHLLHQVSLERHERLSRAGKLLRCKITGDGKRKRPTGRFLDPAKDKYETPLWAWAELLVAMPELLNKVLWDPFFCKGATSAHWKQLRVTKFVHTRGDFFRQIKKQKYDVLVTNPPFSTKQLVLDVLVASGKPFVVLLRTSVLFTFWFRTLVPEFKLVIPSKQINFEGADGQQLSFDSVFVCVGCGPAGGVHACKRS